MRKILFSSLIQAIYSQDIYAGYGSWTQWGEWSECTASNDYGTRVRYRHCEPGLECQGKPYDVEECEENPIFCKDLTDTKDEYEITCTDILNTTLEFDPGSKCNLICNPEYSEYDGETSVICDYTGDWRGEFGECKKPKDGECDPIVYDDENSTIFCSKYWLEDSQCVLQCNEGFHILENQETRCINSTWTEILGECQPDEICEDANQVYSCFLSQCESFCENSNNKKCDKNKECSWGCACKEGFIRDENGNCVLDDFCPCYLDSTELFYDPGSIIYESGCGKECECKGHNWECKTHICSDNTQCHISLSGEESCQEIEDCPSGYIWTKWTDVDAASNGNDRESAKKARSKYPGYGICNDPILSDGRSVDQPELGLSELRNLGWFIRSANDRVVCNKRDQKMKSECPDLEARYCCAANVSEAECPEEAGTWTSWDSTDDNSENGGDYELISTHRERNPQICQHPSAIDYRFNSSYTLTTETVTIDLDHGLICYDKDQTDGSCDDYEVRFCCENKKDLSCLEIKRPITGTRPNPSWLPPDSCCRQIPYSSHLKICCNDFKLADIDDGCR